MASPLRRGLPSVARLRQCPYSSYARASACTPDKSVKFISLGRGSAWKKRGRNVGGIYGIASRRWASNSSDSKEDDKKDGSSNSSSSSGEGKGEEDKDAKISALRGFNIGAEPPWYEAVRKAQPQWARSFLNRDVFDVSKNGYPIPWRIFPTDSKPAQQGQPQQPTPDFMASLAEMAKYGVGMSVGEFEEGAVAAYKRMAEIYNGSEGDSPNPFHASRLCKDTWLSDALDMQLQHTKKCGYIPKLTIDDVKARLLYCTVAPTHLALNEGLIGLVPNWAVRLRLQNIKELFLQGFADKKSNLAVIVGVEYEVSEKCEFERIADSKEGSGTPSIVNEYMKDETEWAKFLSEKADEAMEWQAKWAAQGEQEGKKEAEAGAQETGNADSRQAASVPSSPSSSSSAAAAAGAAEASDGSSQPAKLSKEEIVELLEEMALPKKRKHYFEFECVPPIPLLEFFMYTKLTDEEKKQFDEEVMHGRDWFPDYCITRHMGLMGLNRAGGGGGEGEPIDIQG